MKLMEVDISTVAIRYGDLNYFLVLCFNVLVV